MGLEERRREQSEQASVKSDQDCCRRGDILEQEIDHSACHHDVQTMLVFKYGQLHGKGEEPQECVYPSLH